MADDDYETRHYCWSCALESVRLLEMTNYQVENKEQIIKELREALLTIPQEEESKTSAKQNALWKIYQ